MRPNPTRCDAAAALEAAEREEREARAAAADLSREAAEAAVARDRALPQLQHHLREDEALRGLQRFKAAAKVVGRGLEIVCAALAYCISQNQAFPTFGQGTFSRLAGAMTGKVYERGDVIVVQGSRAERFFAVRKGKLRVATDGQLIGVLRGSG